METDALPAGDSHVGDDELIDLAHGLRDAAESARSLEHLEHCAQCERRLRSVAGDRVRLLIRPQPRLTDRGIEIAAVGPTTPIRKRILGLPRLLAIPLVTLGLSAAALVFLLIMRATPDLRSDSYWLPAPEEGALRSTSGSWTADPAVREALGAYEHRDTRAALEHFRRLPSVDDSGYFESLRKLYLASLLTMNGEDAEAAKVLSGVDVPSLPEPWRGRGRWILQTVYRHQGRTAEADSLARLLIDEPGDIGERARRVLNLGTSPQG